MSLRPLSFALLALLALSSAAAQIPTTAEPTVTVNLPATYTTNDTIAVIPFTVGFSVDQFACVGTGAAFVVSLEATGEADSMGNGSSGEAPAVDVEPSQLTFQAPAGAGLGNAFDGQGTAVATVTPANPGWAENGTLTVTATVTGLANCAGGDFAANSHAASTRIEFQSPTFAGQGDEDDGQAMPGLGLLALLAALGAALVLRRSK